MQDGVAHHLDLAGAAVASVNLQASIIRLEQDAVVVRAGQRQARSGAVTTNVGLDSAEQRRALFSDDTVVVYDNVIRTACEDELHLPSVPPPRGEQRIPRQRRGLVLVAAHDRRVVAGERCDPRPQLGRGVEEEQVHVSLDRQRVQQAEVASGEGALLLESADSPRMVAFTLRPDGSAYWTLRIQKLA
jgi:hypothetical protein